MPADSRDGLYLLRAARHALHGAGRLLLRSLRYRITELPVVSSSSGDRARPGPRWGTADRVASHGTAKQLLRCLTR